MRKPKQRVESTYKKVTQIQHVLLRPDTYIGSIQLTETSMWIWQSGSNKFQYKKIKYIAGLYKIFDQILVNAADNYQRDHKMSKIDVDINQKTGMITVMNDGKSIPVQIHKQHKIYVAELIFGHLLTSSNYEDTKKKVTGGRNGYGAKLTNIFSTYFAIQTADSTNRKLLTIQWRDNMSKMSIPQTMVYNGKDYTKITFIPDFKKFGVQSFPPDTLSLFKKRVYDLAGILKCSIYLNGQLLNVLNFKDYVMMYLKNTSQDQLIIDDSADNPRWKVALTKSQGQFQQVSFVNAVCTINGGTHVSYICDQIVQKLQVILSKKIKDIPIKPFQIKSHFNIFINCLIQNPNFNSQTKQILTLNQNYFGSGWIVSDKIIKDIVKIGIVDSIVNQVRNKQNSKIQKQLKKIKNSDNKLVVPKLQDANLAGKANHCTLILTQGDSAKSLAMCGIQKLGRDYYGVFPLRGKVFNVRDMTAKQVMQNSQLSNIVKIIGLSFGKIYTNTTDLRYQSVMIMADQDTDGSHIKGLLLNFFYTFWPSLCQIKGFLKQFITPIVRCRKGNQKIDFFSQRDYQLWKIDDRNDWKVKYYKGLGTSTDAQGKQYFSNLSKHEICFIFEGQKQKQYFDLAFAKKNADGRKKWLEQFNKGENIDYNIKELTITDFFNKEFRYFSISDNVRSIPSIMDGLKPSQRKILFACFKRNLKNEIKVAQLAGYVSQHSAYHHGEMSLCSTIISMAQNFIGSNNLNLLQPIGQFGTRHMNGKDSASSRYIYTCLNPLTRYLFPQPDDHIVQYQKDENTQIQPIYYYPILPLILINGTQGIGTGWSTTIYPHKIADIISMIKQRIKGQYKFINIGWQHYQGDIKLQKKGIYSIKGLYHHTPEQTTITQIPIGKSIHDYKQFLQQKLKSLENPDPDLNTIHQYHLGNKIQFIINFIQGKQPPIHQLDKYLKLQSKIQQNNMILFNSQGHIQKYQTIADIMEQFYGERIKAYCKRKIYLKAKFLRQAQMLESKILFINAVMMGKFKMMDTKQSWIRQLTAQKYKKYQQFPKVQQTKTQQPLQPQSPIPKPPINKSYNYLLTLPIYTFCQQKVIQLQQNLLQKQKLIKYYQQVQQTQLWLNDIQEFQQAWLLSTSTNLSATSIDNKKINNYGKNNYRLKRKQITQLGNQQGLKTMKKVKVEKKNIMEMEVEKDQNIFKSLDARKSGKEDWYRYEFDKGKPSLDKQQQKINTLISKYFKPDPTPSIQPPMDSLSQRIKNRAMRNQQTFEKAYTEQIKKLQQQPSPLHIQQPPNSQSISQQ